MRQAALIGLLAMLLPATSGAADTAAGEALFQRCLICHTIKAGAGSKVGPDLHSVFGRKAGTYDSFGYSEAMKKSGLVWDDRTLSAFLGDPQKDVPGNHMAFRGIKDKRALADLLAYLHQAAR